MPSQRYTEGPPAFRAASVVPLDSTRTWAFPWILSSAVPAFLESLAGGSLEQPPNAATVSTRKQQMRALRFIRRVLAFETFSSESEGITEHDRSQRVGRPMSQQSSNVLFGQSRNVLLTGSSLEGGRRTTTDDPGRARPAGGLEEGQEETDHAEAGCRGDRHHRAAGAATPAEAAAERRPGGNP